MAVSKLENKLFPVSFPVSTANLTPYSSRHLFPHLYPHEKPPKATQPSAAFRTEKSESSVHFVNAGRKIKHIAGRKLTPTPGIQTPDSYRRLTVCRNLRRRCNGDACFQTVFQPVGLSADVQNMSMMQKPVQQCRCQYIIAEQFAPVAEIL